MFNKMVFHRVLATIAVLIPPAILALLISKYSVNVPLWDQWEDDIAGIFTKYYGGTLCFGDLLAQHNEERQFFPRIFFLALGKLTHWNVRYEMAASFVTACLILLMTYRLQAPSFTALSGVRFVAILLASMLIFSPSMYEAWLWGLEVVCFVPLACLLAGLLLARLKVDQGIRVGGCAILATLSTYSFGNGFLVWLLLFPSLFYSQTWKIFWQQRWGIIVWLASFAVNETVYFHDYHHPARHQPLTALLVGCLEQPVRTGQFLCAFFGGPLAVEGEPPLPLATTVGAVLIVLVLVACGWIYRLRNRPALLRQLAPWSSMVAYSLFSGALATLARSGQFGAEAALSSRYGIFAVTLIVGLVHIFPLLAFEETAQRRSSMKVQSRFRMGLNIGAALLVALHCLAFSSGAWAMRSTWQYRVMGKSWLAFIHIVPEQRSITELLYPNYDALKRKAAALQKLGLLVPPPFTEYPGNLFGITAATREKSLGELENIQRLQGGYLLFGGWAVAPSYGSEADSVLLTYQQGGEPPRPFTLMNDRVRRPDLATLIGEEPYYYAGWQAECNSTNLPKALLTVKAWGYDAERQTTWPLAGEQALDNREETGAFLNQ